MNETDVVEISEFSWANLCREGSLQGAVDLVASACEQAIQTWPDSPEIREAAAIKAAQQGDFSEAIAHFEWLVENVPNYAHQAQWRQWRETLEAGRNPFASEASKG